MGCASSTPLAQAASGAESTADAVAGKVRQTVSDMADAVPVEEMIDGVSHAKDGAMHKLHDFGETVKDKVESVVEDVEEKISSAFGTAKEKTDEKMEEVNETVEKVENDIDETTEKAMEEVEKEVDTMVEDLEESLPPPPKAETPPATTADFQMDGLEVQQGSRASTSRLSRKSGGEDKTNVSEVVEEVKIDRDSLASSKSVKSLQLEDYNSPQETIIEPKTDVPVSAIPVERQESSKDEGEEKGKEKEKEASPLTVALPPEEKETEVNTSSEQEVQLTPSPVPPMDTPRPQSSHEDTRSPVQEPPVESKTASPQESPKTEEEPSNEGVTIEQDPVKTIPTPPASPDGHDDSAISSSSISPEKLDDAQLEERQQTPIIEVN